MEIDLSKYEIVKDRSVYNDNYYKAKGSNTRTLLHEICHEDQNFSEYYLVDESLQVFLGCSNADVGDIIYIDFGLMHT